LGASSLLTDARIRDKRCTGWWAENGSDSLTDAEPDCKLTECRGVTKLADIPTVPETLQGQKEKKFWAEGETAQEE
jgi:hypothetical protein